MYKVYLALIDRQIASLFDLREILSLTCSLSGGQEKAPQPKALKSLKRLLGPADRNVPSFLISPKG